MSIVQPKARKGNKKAGTKNTALSPQPIDVGTPPLSLLSYFFTKCFFNVNPAWGQSQNIDQQEHYEVTSTVSLRKMEAGVESSNQTYIVQLKVKTTPQAMTPYAIEVEAIGLFSVADFVLAEKREKVANTSGTAILYTATRDFILTVTGRGPLKPLMLPTRSFIPMVKKIDDAPHKNSIKKK